MTCLDHVILAADRGTNAVTDEIRIRRRNRIRSALINTAIDSSLALSIFRVISGDKDTTTARSSLVPSLESNSAQLQVLEVQVLQAAYVDYVGTTHTMIYGDLTYILGWIGSSWICERGYQNHDRKDNREMPEATVREMGKKARLEIGEWLEEDLGLYPKGGLLISGTKSRQETGEMTGEIFRSEKNRNVAMWKMYHYRSVIYYLPS
ncbi:hypothetical protein F4804DRAFT_322726 [Jackrogersella minutella]|nr:hypothetical protein F4804DRAFT_322726 [Jackrogersella minutella]